MNNPEQASQVTAADLRAALPQLTERERDMYRYEDEVIRRLDAAASALESRDRRIRELEAELDEAKAREVPEGLQQMTWWPGAHELNVYRHSDGRYRWESGCGRWGYEEKPEQAIAAAELARERGKP